VSYLFPKSALFLVPSITLQLKASAEHLKDSMEVKSRASSMQQWWQSTSLGKWMLRRTKKLQEEYVDKHGESSAIIPQETRESIRDILQDDVERHQLNAEEERDLRTLSNGSDDQK
jgi:hypothetical protein